jgi:YggT family protein
MGILAFLIEALILIADTLLSVYMFVVIGAVLISWVNADPYNPIVRILHNLTEPVLWRIRKFLPFTYKSGLDFSPVVLLLGVQLLKMAILRILYSLLASMSRGIDLL